GFRYGVPQAIVSGTWIGLEHAIVWTLWYDSRQRNVDPKSAAAFAWGGATVLGLAGGLVAFAASSTPGRASWVGSSALWTSTVSGFAAAGFQKHDQAPLALAVAGIGLSAGTAAGLLTAGSVSPSIARVRLIDLSAILGGFGGA